MRRPDQLRRLEPRLGRRLLVWPAVMLVAVAGYLILFGTRHGSEAAPRPGLQRILDGLVTGPSRIAPGVTAYVSGPHGTWTGSAGLADVRTGEPMRVDARMRLESVSKLWTATLVLQLAADGKLALDDTVGRWLPGVVPNANRITLRELLNHTSGLIDTNDITADPAAHLAEVADPALRAKLRSVAARLAKDPGFEFPPRVWVEFAGALPPYGAPGMSYHYSNIGYIVAGLIAERAGGESLATMVRKRIVEPLHLAAAAYDPRAAISGAHARGYNVAPNGKLTDTTTWTGGLGANGGVVSDAADEARFLTSLMSGKLLGPKQLAALKTAPWYSSYALGTGVDETGCAGIAFGHNGGGAGFATSVYVSGDGARVSVVLLNGRTSDSHGDAIGRDAMNRLYCAA